MAWLAFINRKLVREVAERHAAEAAQRQSEARYRAVFANTADYHYVIEVGDDGVFRIAEVNPAYERATGRNTADLRGLDIRQLGVEAESTARAATLQRVVDEGQSLSVRDTFTLTRVGRVRIWESILVPVRGETGRVELIVGSSRDVTEREQAEEELRRAHRMEAVGHLTGGVAHDFNNLLQVIRGNLELIAAEIDDREPAAQRLKNALHGANRAAQLTRQLLAFARKQPLEPKVVNLGRLVTDMAEMLRATLGESVAIECIIAGGLWNTLADPAQVESAILNLAINARDAMAEGGRLTIEIANAVLDEAYIAREPELEAGQYVMIAVSDTGSGMPPETVARVFEPFFTTKGEEKGTGLGLSMVYGFVKQSRGHAQIHSEVGHGTTVKIYLPRSEESSGGRGRAARRGLPARQQRGYPGGRRRRSGPRFRRRHAARPGLCLPSRIGRRRGVGDAEIRRQGRPAVHRCDHAWAAQEPRSRPRGPESETGSAGAVHLGLCRRRHRSSRPAGRGRPSAQQALCPGGSGAKGHVV